MAPDVSSPASLQLASVGATAAPAESEPEELPEVLAGFEEAAARPSRAEAEEDELMVSELLAASVWRQRLLIAAGVLVLGAEGLAGYLLLRPPSVEHDGATHAATRQAATRQAAATKQAATINKVGAPGKPAAAATPDGRPAAAPAPDAAPKPPDLGPPPPDTAAPDVTPARAPDSSPPRATSPPPGKKRSTTRRPPRRTGRKKTKRPRKKKLFGNPY
jgi:hypothetical protein